jgi:hypothetical protein
MKLECFPLVAYPPEIVPGRPQRAWMDAFNERHPYRCLPLTVANTTGWELLCPVGFTAEWNGGVRTQDIRFIPDEPHPGFKSFALSHFSHGVVTFPAGYLFRTPPGWSMWCEGPPNQIKDGIQPLVGLVETDWLPFPFTMNWRFTRPGRVRFEKGEAFCFLSLVEDKKLEDFEVEVRALESEPELKGQWEAWTTSRGQFNSALAQGDPAAIKTAWQRFYFRGEAPAAAETKPVDHVTRRRLQEPKTRGKPAGPSA